MQKLKTTKNMTGLEMLQYKHTKDMESLYLMLKNDSTIYELWHDTATRLAKRVLAAKDLDFEEVEHEYSRKITPSLRTLCIRHYKACGEQLDVDDEKLRIVAWQWFYNDIMETALFLKQ